MDINRSRKLSTGTGAQLRQLFARALQDADRLPGRRELQAELEEILPDAAAAPIREALAKKWVELAQRAQDRQERFGLRGRADEFVLDVVDMLARVDRLVPAADEEPVDLDAVLKHVDDYRLPAIDRKLEADLRQGEHDLSLHKARTIEI